MKRIDNRQSKSRTLLKVRDKLPQFGFTPPLRAGAGFRRIKDKSIQIKRNKRGQHLIDPAPFCYGASLRSRKVRG